MILSPVTPSARKRVGSRGSPELPFNALPGARTHHDLVTIGSVNAELARARDFTRSGAVVSHQARRSREHCRVRPAGWPPGGPSNAMPPTRYCLSAPLGFARRLVSPCGRNRGLVRASEEAERRLPPETPPPNSIPGLNAWRPPSARSVILRGRNNHQAR
jgi:hypothetical protein